VDKIKSEKGQALVLLVLAFVVLLGFTALAIDGGMVYSDRRRSQNGSDASSLAGAGAAGRAIRSLGAQATKDNWNCALFDPYTTTWDNATNQAIATAGLNGFVITTDLTDSNHVELKCYSTIPHLDVTVTLRTEVPTNFAHFVYRGPLVNTVESVARVFPSPPEGEGECIISLTDKCQGNQKGTVINGSINVMLNGCGTWSNSCTYFDGSSGSFSADSVTYKTELDCNPADCPTFNVSRIKQTSTRKNIDIPRPDCEADFGPKPKNPPDVKKGNKTIDPGWYGVIQITDSKDDLTLNPGLYCITDNFAFNGNTLNGEGVTIAVLGKKGFSTSGSSTVILKAPPVGCDVVSPSYYPGCPHAVGGLLIWVPSTNTGDVSLLGNSSSIYRGTVFVQEGGGSIVIGGTASEGAPNYGTSLIGDTVKVSGTSDVTINYDPGDIYHGPAFMESAK
jgi:Flp pilus assembly protein TadG